MNRRNELFASLAVLTGLCLVILIAACAAISTHPEIATRQFWRDYRLRRRSVRVNKDIFRKWHPLYETIQIGMTRAEVETVLGDKGISSITAESVLYGPPVSDGYSIHSLGTMRLCYSNGIVSAKRYLR